MNPSLRLKLSLFVVATVVFVATTVGDLHAHEIRPALLDITEREPGLFDAK